MRWRTSGALTVTALATVAAAAIIVNPVSGHAADAPACVVDYHVDQWNNGFQATYQGSNDAPVDFTLNGVRCNDTSPPSTPPSTPPTTPQPPAGCPSGAFCDGFESQTGSVPTGDWSLMFPNCQGTGTATVDSSVSHSGGKSVRIDGRAGYCNHVFLATTRGMTGSGLYVRFYVRHTTALPESHVTFAAMKDTADGGKDLRMGGQNRALQWNRESDDATLPEQSPAGVAQSVPLAVNQWSCVEFGITGSELRTWLNGNEVPGLRADGVPTPDVDAQWLRRAGWRPSLANFRLGWESYGNGDDTLWFDDIVMAPSRIGCS